MIFKIEKFFHLMIIGLAIQWTSSYPTGQTNDIELSDLVIGLTESKAGATELETLLNSSLQRWCDGHDLPMVCEHSDSFLSNFVPPVIELNIQNETATFSLLKCFIENSTVVLNEYNSAFERSGNRMGINHFLYTRITLNMKGLYEDLKSYLDLNLSDNECNTMEPTEFEYKNEGQHFKTMTSYNKQLNKVIFGLRFFIDSFSSQ